MRYRNDVRGWIEDIRHERGDVAAQFAEEGWLAGASAFDAVVAERDAVRDALAGVMPFVEYPAECICDKTPTSECNCNLEWAQANYQRNLNAANAALAAVRREAAR